jgi:hypothetical protein
LNLARTGEANAQSGRISLTEQGQTRPDFMTALPSQCRSCQQLARCAPSRLSARSGHVERRTEMASWFWINVPLMAVFFLATAGIPLWLVLRRPDWSGGNKRPSAAAEAGIRRPEKTHPRRTLQPTH